MMKIAAATVLCVIAGVVSGAPSASPVLSAVSDTARFSWEIPKGGMGAGDTFLALNPAGTNVFLVTGTGVFLPTDKPYWGRLVFLGNIAARNVTFTMSNISKSDAGTYGCRNAGSGNVIQNCGQELIVLDGPDTNQVRVTKPANTVVAEDRDLTLTCETLTSVSPGVTFTWDYSDGCGITGGSTGSVTGSAGTTWSQTRTFRPIRSKTDVRCSVRNTRTAVAVNKTLSLGDVKYPPPGRPTVQDFTSVMYAGVQKTIRCTVTGGNPLADITWSCYNTSNTGSESSRAGTKTSSLTFLVTKHQNSRQCQCGASWMYGGYDETVTHTFTVYYPPDKPTTTNPGTLCEGKSTSLTCSSSPDPGNPPATFYWTKNNAAVHTGSSYTFSPVKADNGADIRCAAGNTYTDRAGFSRPQSDARQLSVYYVGVPTITPAATQTRKEGQSLSLTCSADGNPDNTVIAWTFNDSPMAGSSVMKADLNRSDDGEYGCTGRVNTGSGCPGGSLQGRSTVRVIVNYAPDITFSPVDITEGQPLTLKCEARGRPASYTFGSFIQYWGNTSVDSRAGTPSGGDYTWSVGAATYLDTGVYECRVDNTVTDRNDVLVQRKRVSINVRAHPKFTGDSKQRFGPEVGTNTTLVQSFYNSDLNYTSYNWTFGQLDTPVNRPGSVRSSQVTLRKNNKEVQHAGFSVSLEIQNFQEQDIGVYTVTVCNVVGCNSSQVNLTAAGPPLVPLEFKVVNTTDTSIQLRWKSNYPGGDYTQTFLLHYRVETSGEWKTQEYEDNPGGYVYADVTGLQSGTRYEFKVVARNTREQNSEGPFTQVESQETTRNPDKSDVSGSSLGIGLGAGLGICIIVIIMMGAALIYRRRRHLLSPHDRGKPPAPIQDRDIREQPIGNTQNSDIQDLSQYARFEECASQPYSQLKIYVNTKGPVPHEPEYEGLQERSPATYEALALQTYENMDRKVKDPTYANTSTTG